LAGQIRLVQLIGYCLSGHEFSNGVDERRARVQPCHISLGLMRALAPEVHLSSCLGERSPRKEMTLPRVRQKAYLSG
jgi:hypothetical protein